MILPQEDKKILELKYKSPNIGSLSSSDLSKWSNALLLKIHVITGWNFPDESLMLILKDQFQKKLTESYPTVNIDEIEHAFRINETGVKDWGKSMNLFLIDEIMQPYLNRRFELSKLEEQAKQNTPQLPPSPITAQEIIDTAWNLWLSTSQLDYIDEDCYDILTTKKFINLSIEQKKELFSKANQYLIMLERESPHLYKNDTAAFRHATQRRYAKKMAVANFFTEYKTVGKTIQL